MIVQNTDKEEGGVADTDEEGGEKGKSIWEMAATYDSGWVPASVADEGRLGKANCGAEGEVPEEGGGKRKKRDGRRQQAVADDSGWVPASVADEGRLGKANCGAGGKVPEERTGGGKRKKRDGRRQQAAARAGGFWRSSPMKETEGGRGARVSTGRRRRQT
ncbi:hypothetical protein ACLOJK_030421 [Asimina triloba]